ncbi:MAG: hypothetical protein KGL26_03075 [Pseudomonadota bacterium]|nr:hypothetical protein [Pseudomonadota bacterium]
MLRIAIALAIALIAAPRAVAQVYSVNPYTGQVYDPAGRPLGAPSADDFARAPDYRLPTAPDDRAAQDADDRQRMLDDLDQIERNTEPSYSTIPDPPPPYYDPPLTDDPYGR